MPAGVQKAMFEGPVLGQVVPAIILLLPAIVAKPAYDFGGERFRIQRSDPEPFVFRSFRRELIPSIMILRERFFGTHDPDGLRIVGRKRQAFGVPELYLIMLASALFGHLAIGGTAGEQPDGGLIQVGKILFQTDDQIPAHLLGQLEAGACAYRASSKRISK